MIDKATFTYHETEVAGVESVEISADYNREAFLTSGLGMRGYAMIRVHGRHAIADAVLRSLGAIYSSRESLEGVRFGPSGRRHYRYISEEIVNRIVESIWETSRSSSRERERSSAVGDFAVDLIDLI